MNISKNWDIWIITIKKCHNMCVSQFDYYSWEIFLHMDCTFGFLIYKYKILVCCQFLYKILIIISNKCAQDEIGGILFLFNMYITRK